MWAATNLMATASSSNLPGTAGTYGFYQEWNLSYRTVNPIGSPATGAVVTYGITICSGFAAPYQTFSPPAGTLGNFTAWDTNSTYFLWPTMFTATGTANNYITTQIVKLYGEN